MEPGVMQPESSVAFAPLSARDDVAWRWLAPWVLMAAVWIAYAPGFSAPFVLDSTNIYQMRVIRDLTDPAMLLNARPLFTVTLAINYALHGFEPTGYRVLNALVHALAAWCLFAVIRRCLLLPTLGGRYTPARATALALTASLIWALHPLQTQSVTYVIQRGESLCGLAYLVAIFCALRAAQSERPLSWLVLCGLAGLAGLGAKQVIVTLPLMLWVLDRTLLQGALLRAIGRCWWAVALAVVAGLGGLAYITDFGRGFFARNSTAGFALETITPLKYLASQPGVILHYLRLSVWPDALCIDHGWPLPRTLAGVVVPAAALAVPVLLGLWGAARRRPWAFLPLAFFIHLAPTSSIMPIADLLMEHRVYLALAPVAMGLVLAGDALMREGPPAITPVACVLAIAVIIGLSARTIVRNLAHHDSEGLWRTCIALNPRHGRALTNLGARLLDRGEADEALALLRRAVEADQPYTAQAPVYLGKALLATGQPQEAWDVLTHAQANQVNRGELQQTLGDTAHALRRPELAAEHYRQAFEFDSINDRHLFSYGWTLLELGQLDKAEEIFAWGARSLSTDTVILSALAVVKAEANRPDADAAWQAAYAALPHLPAFSEADRESWTRHLRTRLQLGRAAARLGRWGDAREQLSLALEVQPGLPDAEAERVEVEARDPAGDRGRALELGRSLVERTQGRHVRSLLALATAWAAAGRLEQAAPLLDRALLGARSLGRPPAEIARIEARRGAIDRGVADLAWP
jgi:tetratricopeptide (TPR) repeat protein